MFSFGRGAGIRRALLGGACAALAMASAVSSAEAALPTIPVNSKVGSLQMPVTCDFPIVGQQTVKLTMTGAVQNNLGPGQPFFLSDTSAIMEVPASVVNLVTTFLRATSVSGTITQMKINGTNLSPATLDAAATPLAFGPVAFTKGKAAQIPIPGSSFMQIGPFTAGTAGTAEVALGETAASLTLVGGKGGKLNIPMKVSCSAPSPSSTVLSMTVGGASSTTVATVASGLKADAFNPGLNTQVGMLYYTTKCNVAGLIQDSYVKLIGTMPTSVKAGEQFSMTNSYGELHLPPASVNQMLTFFPTANSLSATLSVNNIMATNTVEGSVNSAAKTLTTSAAPLVRDQETVLRIPATGTLTVGPFTAKTAGTPSVITVGASNATLLPAMGGLVLLPLSSVCGVPSPAINIADLPVL